MILRSHSVQFLQPLRAALSTFDDVPIGRGGLGHRGPVRDRTPPPHRPSAHSIAAAEHLVDSHPTMGVVRVRVARQGVLALLHRTDVVGEQLRAVLANHQYLHRALVHQVVHHVAQPVASWALTAWYRFTTSLNAAIIVGHGLRLNLRTYTVRIGRHLPAPPRSPCSPSPLAQSAPAAYTPSRSGLASTHSPVVAPGELFDHRHRHERAFQCCHIEGARPTGGLTEFDYSTRNISAGTVWRLRSMNSSVIQPDGFDSVFSTSGSTRCTPAVCSPGRP